MISFASEVYYQWHLIGMRLEGSKGQMLALPIQIFEQTRKWHLDLSILILTFEVVLSQVDSPSSGLVWIQDFDLDSSNIKFH